MLRNPDRLKKYIVEGWDKIAVGDLVNLWRKKKIFYRVVTIYTVRDKYSDEISWNDVSEICGYPKRRISWRLNSPLVLSISDGEKIFQVMYYDVKLIQKKKKILSEKLLKLLK